MTPPPELMDDLVGEILLRLPPDEPEHLFRAALVSKPWLRLLCAAAFRRRYRAFHGAPPLLGLLHKCQVLEGDPAPCFASTTSLPLPDFPHPSSDGRRTRPLDCRHGHVLVHMLEEDPTMGLLPDIDWLIYSAAVFCAADGCDHLDCHGGPFRVVFVATHDYKDTPSVPNYKSFQESWRVKSEAYVQHMRDGNAVVRPRYYTSYLQPRRGTLVGDAIYFTIRVDNTIIKYEWDQNCLSMIKPPTQNTYYIALMAMEDGSLGFSCIEGSSLYLWSRKVNSEGAAEWVQCKVIELETIIPGSNDLAIVVGFAEGVGVIFISTGVGLFTIELKSGRVRKVDKLEVYFSVLPYMSFYTPDRGRLLSLAWTH
ncbi:hypothetical protein PVAP13_2NG027500 [Panicum virgatum]|uniref:F-box domain-containing protein n=1 Tax=Panicum virgatum TaxID=38727 RepID=A0A8T0VAN1_PANVG|nr:hypothetical protein PVAP13_2NG027500 [Panicum virgatum]